MEFICPQNWIFKGFVHAVEGGGALRLISGTVVVTGGTHSAVDILLWQRHRHSVVFKTPEPLSSGQASGTNPQTLVQGMSQDTYQPWRWDLLAFLGHRSSHLLA